MDLRALWTRAVQHQHREAPPRPVQGRADNPVQDWLNAVGLPWLEPRAELAARFGIHANNPYRWDLVPLDIRLPPLPGMLWPFGFQAFARYSPAMPPGTLSTHVWLGDDAEANIRCASEQLAQHLGERPITDRSNTRLVEWRWGAACVTLLAWPPTRQSGPKLNNPAHKRDPRLVTACSVTVQSGWRPPLSPRDQAWLDGFVPLGRTRNWSPAKSGAELAQTWFIETQLEFMREPPADLSPFRGAFGLSTGREALIFSEDALYIIPTALIDAFSVSRTLPAKGGGGSALRAHCQTGYAACPTKAVQVAQGERADDLNDIAAALAAETGKPLTLEPYDYDV